MRPIEADPPNAKGVGGLNERKTVKAGERGLPVSPFSNLPVFWRTRCATVRIEHAMNKTRSAHIQRVHINRVFDVVDLGEIGMDGSPEVLNVGEVFRCQLKMIAVIGL